MADPGLKLQPSETRVQPEALSEGWHSHVSEAAVTERMTMPEEVTPGKNTSRQGTLLKIIAKLKVQRIRPRKLIRT